eukprot:scaffold43066_cov67-Phaeocystis_antarctica.AAC.5
MIKETLERRSHNMSRARVLYPSRRGSPSRHTSYRHHDIGSNGSPTFATIARFTTWSKRV